MAIWIATSYFDNYANYELSYEIISTSVKDGSHTIRIYGTLNVTGNNISWDWGNARVWDNTVSILSYYGNGSHQLVTKDITIYCNSNGDFDRVYADGSITTSYKSGHAEGYIYLPHIDRYPILNSGQNFNDEQNPVYNITSYNTFPIKVKLEAGGNSQLITRSLPASTSGNYTLELTTTERNLLRALIPNNNLLNVRFSVCAMSGNTELNVSYKDYVMTLVNANPIFSNFEFEDINPKTIALTGNNQVCVNGYSNIKATISTLNKAEAIKYATMTKYRFLISGNISIDMMYSNNANVFGTINNANNGTFNIYAIDSRQNSTLVTKLASQEIAYEPIYIDKQNSKIERDDNRVGDGAVLTLNGTFWNNDFGNVINNITSVTYRLKKTDSSTWATGTTTIIPTIINNSFTFSGLIASDNLDTTWDLDSSYNVEVIIEDELTTTTINLILNSATPTLCLDKNGIGIMGAYDSSIGGLLQVDGKIVNPSPNIFINGNVSNGNIYKTGRLINGKDEYIYWREINSLPNNSTGNYETPILMSDISIITDIGGTAIRSSDNSWFVMNCSRTVSTNNIGLQGTVSNNKFAFWIETGADRTNLMGYVWFTFIYN